MRFPPYSVDGDTGVVDLGGEGRDGGVFSEGWRNPMLI